MARLAPQACGIPQTTASLYMRLAENRERIEGQTSNGVANLTVRAALRLLKPKTLRRGTSAAPPKPATPAIGGLNSLAWSDAPAPMRARFVSSVSLQELFKAAPADQQENFRTWLSQQNQPAVEPAPQDLSIPDDLSIPAFLHRPPPAQPEQSTELALAEISNAVAVIADEAPALQSETTDNMSPAARNVLKPPRARRSLDTHRRMKLGDEVVDGLKGTALGTARELDELIRLNGGAGLGEIQPEVRQLIDAAKRGEEVSAIPKHLRRDLPKEAAA
jgi:hypothetical protein